MFLFTDQLQLNKYHIIICILAQRRYCKCRRQLVLCVYRKLTFKNAHEIIHKYIFAKSY